MFHLERTGVAVEVAAAAGAGGGEERSEWEGMELTSGLDRWWDDWMKGNSKRGRTVISHHSSMLAG